MFTLPYTGEEFLAILRKNENLQGSYNELKGELERIPAPAEALTNLELEELLK